MDFDDDGRIYLEDVLSAGEECYEAAAEVAAGASSALVPCLQVSVDGKDNDSVGICWHDVSASLTI
jgi:hypothetical protein